MYESSLLEARKYKPEAPSRELKVVQFSKVHTVQLWGDSLPCLRRGLVPNVQLQNLLGFNRIH